VSIVEEQSQIITAQNTLIKDLKNTNTVELGAVTNDLPLSYSEVTKKSSVILRPKNENQTVSDIKKDLFTNIDPIASKIAISNIKGNRSGGVIITCNSLEDFTRIKGLISDRLSGYNVKDLPLLHPRVRISHIDSSVSQDKLLEYILSQNKSLFSKNFNCVLKKFSPLRNNTTNTLIRRCWRWMLRLIVTFWLRVNFSLGTITVECGMLLIFGVALIARAFITFRDNVVRLNRFVPGVPVIIVLRTVHPQL
jgi:hypothetical protein